MITNDLSVPLTAPEAARSFHPRELRNAFGCFATGVRLVTTDIKVAKTA